MRHRNRSYSRISVADARTDGWSASDTELVSYIIAVLSPPITRMAKMNQVNRALAARLELERRFRVKHGIRMKEFYSPEYRMLFRIEYPELSLIVE